MIAATPPVMKYLIPAAASGRTKIASRLGSITRHDAPRLSHHVIVAPIRVSPADGHKRQGSRFTPQSLGHKELLGWSHVSEPIELEFPEAVHIEMSLGSRQEASDHFAG